MKISKFYQSFLTASFVCFLLSPQAEATFSIVAVDTITGEVGSAGASCIAGSNIIEDVVEGIGAINTQALYLSGNQANAHALLIAGIAPDSIMNWLVANDVQNNSTTRQYGAVTLAGQGASAAFTGGFTTEWKGHLTGPGYSIQGNILLGPQILDSMEFVFLNTSGPLEVRLMAALEAAKVTGADIRCTSVDKSSISAYIKVVRIGDGGIPYISEIVSNTTGSTDPIDLLRVKFDNWQLRQKADPDSSIIISVPDAVRANGTTLISITIVPLNLDGDSLRYPDSVIIVNSGSGTLSAVVDNGDNTYSATITSDTVAQFDTLTVFIEAGGELVQLNSRPTVIYYACGDVNLDLTGLNIIDLTSLVDFIFRGGAPPPILDAADLDGGGGFPNILDLTDLIDYIFRSGPKPTCGW